MDTPGLSHSPVIVTMLAENTPLLGGASLAYWIAIGLVAGGVLIIAIVVMGMLRGRSRSTTDTVDGERAVPASDSTAAPSGSSSLDTVQEAQQLLRLMGDAEELCVRLSAQLDAKARELESLIVRAEAAAGAIASQTSPDDSKVQAEDEIRNMPVRQAGLVSRPVNESRPVPAPQTPAAAAAPTQDVRTPTIVTRPMSAIAPTPARTASAESAPVDSVHASNNGLDALATQVYTLADRGLSSQDIARTLREHPGKIELILALRTR